MGLDKVEHWTVLDSIDGAVERLSEYRAVGVSEFLMLTLGPDALDQYESLAEVNARLSALVSTASAYRYDASALREVFEHRFTYVQGIERNSHRFARNVALRDPASGRSWTYAELWRDAGRLADALRSQRVAPGDSVVYALFNGPEFALLWVACLRLGAVATPINFRLSAGEIAHVLDDSRPRAFVFDEALERTAADALTRAEHQPSLLAAVGEATAPAYLLRGTARLGRSGRRGPSSGRHDDLRRDDASVHLGDDRHAEGRLAVQPHRDPVGARRDHAFPARAAGPHAQHDAVVPPRRPVLRRPESRSSTSAPSRSRCASSILRPCSTGSRRTA